MIDIQHLTVKYGAVPALSDISLSVNPGECLLVTGPSGCGKSTLAKAISGLIPQVTTSPDERPGKGGWINTREQPIAELAQRVGIVFQNPAAQLFHLTVADEVAFGPRNLGLTEQEVKRRVAWSLEATGLTRLAR